MGFEPTTPTLASENSFCRFRSSAMELVSVSARENADREDVGILFEIEAA